VNKKYVPMFPHFYLRDKGVGERPNTTKNFGLNNVRCHFYRKDMKKPGRGSDDNNLYDGMSLASSVQVAFEFNNQNLLPGTREHSFRPC
jgi:hypothetical protein